MTMLAGLTTGVSDGRVSGQHNGWMTTTLRPR
jgi:hypothetical protein